MLLPANTMVKTTIYHWCLPQEIFPLIKKSHWDKVNLRVWKIFNKDFMENQHSTKVREGFQKNMADSKQILLWVQFLFYSICVSFPCREIHWQHYRNSWDFLQGNSETFQKVSITNTTTKKWQCAAASNYS